MTAGELLMIVGVSLTLFAVLCGAWVGGHRAADRAADRAANVRAERERRVAAARHARMLRGGRPPLTQEYPGASGIVREGPFVDPDATREIRIPPYMRMPDTAHRRQHRRYNP